MHLDTISFLDFYENNYPILLTRHNEKSRFLDYPSRRKFIYNDWILRILQEDIENFARDFIKYTVKCFYIGRNNLSTRGCSDMWAQIKTDIGKSCRR